MADNDQPDYAAKFRGERDKYAQADDPPVEVRRAELVQPAEKPAEEPQDPQQQRRDAATQVLDQVHDITSGREKQMLDKIDGQVQDLQKLINAPTPAPPQPATAPPPPTEQQKGGLTEFVFNLLKFGALAAIAFGAGRRGAAHNAIYKGAIGAALTAYTAGRKDVANHAMQIWEKNREVINDANRQQHEYYKDILENNKLSLEHKMNAIHALSTEFGDYKTYAASREKNLTEVQKDADAKMKLQRHKEEFEIQHRDKVYSVLGKNQMTAQYLDWLNKKSGGKINLTPGSSADDWYKVEKEHPELSFSSFKKEHDQEELKQLSEKERIKTEARLKAQKEAKEGADKTPDATEGAAKAAKILEGLVQ